MKRRHRSLSTSIVLFVATLLAVPADGAARDDADSTDATARAARLVVESVPGARYELDTGASATVPRALDGVEPGLRRVKISHPGYKHRTELVRLGAGESYQLIAPLTAKSRRGALVRAALFPGWGSYYMEKHRSTQVLSWVSVLSAAGAIGFDRWMQDRVDTYDERLGDYNSAVSPDRIASAYSALAAAHDDVKTAESWRNGFLGALAGAYALSIAQAILRFPDWNHGIELGAAPAITPSGARVSLITVPLR